MLRRIFLLSGQEVINWLLRDEYTDTLAAGSIAGTLATPGPGTRSVVTDTNSKLSIGSGKLNIATGGNNYGDPGIWYSALTRATGLMMVAKINMAAGTEYFVGLDTNTASVPNAHAYYFVNTTALSVYDNAIAIAVATPVQATDYYLAIILRPTGAHYAIKGGAFTSWTLLWVSATLNTATLYPNIADKVNTICATDFVRAIQLSGLWSTDYAVATQRLAGARSAGDVFAHQADCLIEFTVTTVPTADQIEVWFRSPTVGTDGWRVTIDNTGALDLDEVVATVVTQRGTAAGVIVNGDRIVIVAFGETIKVYEANNLRITYALAATQKTQTNGELETEGTDGSVSDIVAWPRTLSGSEASEIDKYIA